MSLCVTVTLADHAKQYAKYGAVLFLSIASILFSTLIKYLFHPSAYLMLNRYTIYGLLLLWLISMLGLLVSMLLKRVPILHNFPILGWVSIFSMIFCIPGTPCAELIIKSINSVDLLAITTPILTYAGISVVNRIPELKQTSWRILIVAIVVFIGMYIGSAALAQLGLSLKG